jgi:hypothetical protein
MGFFNRFLKTKKNNSKQRIELPPIPLNRQIKREAFQFGLPVLNQPQETRKLVFGAPGAAMTRPLNGARIRRQSGTRKLNVNRAVNRPINVPVNITRARVPLMNNNNNYIYENLTTRRAQRKKWLNMAAIQKKQLFGPSEQLGVTLNIRRLRNGIVKNANGSLVLFNNETVRVPPPPNAVTGLLNSRSNSLAGTVNEFNNNELNNESTNSISSENRNLIAVFGRRVPLYPDIIRALNNGMFQRVFNYIMERKPINMVGVPLNREAYGKAKGIAKRNTYLLRIAIRGLLVARGTIIGYAGDLGIDPVILSDIIDFYTSLSSSDQTQLIESIKYYICQYIRAYEAANPGTPKSGYCP